MALFSGLPVSSAFSFYEIKHTPSVGRICAAGGVCFVVSCDSGALPLLLAVPAVGAELAFIQAGSFDQIVQAVEA